MKTKRITLKDVLKGERKDVGFSFYFDREKSISKVARLVREARQQASMTQSELAKKAKTSQTVIARLESGNDRRIPSLDLLERIAKAFKARLRISLDYQPAA